MKVELNTEIKNLDGDPFKDGEKSLTLGKVCTLALLEAQPAKQDGNITLDDTVKRYELSLRVKDNATAELESKDILLIKELLPKRWSIIVTGQAARLLEGKKSDIGNQAKEE